MKNMPITQKIEKIFASVEKSLPPQVGAQDEKSPENSNGWPNQAEDGSSIFPIDETNDLPPLAENDYGVDPGVGEAISESGIEAIAIYKSPRFINQPPFKGMWGIFIFRQRFLSLVNTMVNDTQSPFQECSFNLHRFIDGHEKFHFKVDSQALELESFTGQPIWRPYLARLQRSPIIDWYEEGIANSSAFASIKRHGRTTMPTRIDHIKFIKDLIEASPGAYAFGTRGPTALASIRGEMAKQILGIPPNAQPSGNQEFQIKAFNDRLSNSGFCSKIFNPNAVPRFWVSNSRAHQSSRPLAIKINEMRDGFVIKYLNGQFVEKTDHERFRIDNKDLIKVPNPHSKDLRNYEFKNLIDHAGMTKFEFELERGRTKKWQKNIPRDPIKPSKIKTSN